MSTFFTYSTDTGYEVSTLVDLLAYRAQHQSEQMAYSFLQNGGAEVRKLTYKELDRLAQAIAVKLQSLDATGGRALLLYSPSLEFIAAFFGCLYAGVVAVPAYPPRPNQNIARLQAITADARARVVLTSVALRDNLKNRFARSLDLGQLHWLATDELTYDFAEAWYPPQVNGDTLALLQYTSGSTGNPKGVTISHSNLLYNSAVIQKGFEDTPGSRGVSWLPPYHDMGLIGGILQPLYVGAPMWLMSPIDFLQKPFRWLQAISRYKATTSGGPNFAYELCLQKTSPEQRATLDLSSWEVAFTGAEPVRAQTLEQFAAAFEAFYPCYGMAETTLMISGGLKTALPVVRKLESAAFEQNRVVEVTDEWETVRTVVGCGRSSMDHKIVIVDPESMTLCHEGHVGEIWVSGSSVAQGYWNRAEETRQTFQAYLVDTGEGPFLRTGDLGFLLNGELFVTGRLKDVIIIRGQNHYPQDIEMTVSRSHPALRPNYGAAFAIEFKGSERLVIVQEVERSYLRKLDVKEVVSSVKQAVVAEHGLEIYAAVLVKTGSIPQTSSGKIRRHACRAEFISGSLNIVDDWSENPQGTSKFINLQAEIEGLLQKVQNDKQA